MSKEVIHVRGIGAATAAVLAEHGIQSVEDLAATDIAELLVIPGFSNIRAKQVIENAKALLPEPKPVKKIASAADKKAAKKTQKKGTKKKKKEKKKKKKPVKKEKEKKKASRNKKEKKKAKAKKMNS